MIVNILDDDQLAQIEDIIVNQYQGHKMTTDQLKQQNDLTAAECDALLKLILSHQTD